MIRALIVDDEPLARETVRVRLERERDVEIVGEAADGFAAVETIRRAIPDVVFLDVQMPGMDGFEVLDQVGGDVLPAVVFVTAYDRFALRAFEVHALDYLLKPFTAERLQKALEHVRRDLERGDGAGREQIAGLLDARAAALASPSGDGPVHAHRLTVRDGERYLLLRTSEIDWVEAAANYVRLYARDRSFLMRGTMASITMQLDPHQFARIHRSTIVNVDRVSEIRPEWHGDFDVVLSTGKVLRLGRSYRSALLPR